MGLCNQDSLKMINNSEHCPHFLHYIGHLKCTMIWSSKDIESKHVCSFITMKYSQALGQLKKLSLNTTEESLTIGLLSIQKGKYEKATNYLGSLLCDCAKKFMDPVGKTFSSHFFCPCVVGQGAKGQKNKILFVFNLNIYTRNMSLVSPVFHTAVTVSIGLKNILKTYWYYQFEA